jgi:hypothetical protein
MPVACRDVAQSPAATERALIPQVAMLLDAAAPSVRSSLAGASDGDWRIEVLRGDDLSGCLRTRDSGPVFTGRVAHPALAE